jgi:agmatinase
MFGLLNIGLSLAAVVLAHGDHDHDQSPLQGALPKMWFNTLPGDGGTQVGFELAQLKCLYLN